MITKTHRREYERGLLGRYRTYLCRECGYKFQIFRLEPLPRKERVCNICKKEGNNGA